MPDRPHPHPAGPANGLSLRLYGQIAAATFSRLIINTARRFPYPFATVLSRGMGVSLTAVTGLIAINQITAFLGIFFGPLADRFGYRMMMLGGLGMLAIGMAAGGFFPFYGVILVSLFLAGLGKSVFDPALQAYVGERVPYHRRGRIIGILEICWAGSTLVGIPAVALCIERLGWRAPFFLLGGLGMVGWLFLRRWLPADRPAAATDGGPSGMKAALNTIGRAWQLLLREKAAVGAVGFVFFVSAGNDALFVVYGAWLERSFGLSVLALGVGTGVIGAAELLGEMVTAGMSDRMGLVRSVAAGLFLNIVCCLLLPVIGHTLFWALFGLFLIFLTFEFTIVSAISLCTELVPGARATMMSVYFAAAGFGRVAGAFLGGPIWLSGGILATGITAAAAGAAGLAILLWGLNGWRHRG